MQKLYNIMLKDRRFKVALLHRNLSNINFILIPYAIPYKKFKS